MNGTAATVLVAMAALLGVRAPAPASAQLAPGTRRSLISSGTTDCTLGAGPARHCLNGAPGTDGTGACSADSQCVGGTPIGACDLDANCFFGPPVPVPGPIASLSVCIMNAIGVGVAGTADAGSTTVSTTLSSRVYITGNATSDRKSTRLNSSHVAISYAVFCLKKKKKKIDT